MLHTKLHDQLIEVIGGRSLGGMVEIATGFSARRVASLVTTESGRAAVRRATRARFRAQALERGLSAPDADELVEVLLGAHDAPDDVSPFATLAAVSLGRRDWSSFVSTRLAGERLDRLNVELAAARKADSIRDARAAIEAAGFADSSWFADYDQDPSGGEQAAFWKGYLEADSWEALGRPLGALAMRTLFDWLATWDVDFCLSYFPKMEPISTFEWVAPTISPRAFQAQVGAKRCRKLYDPPSRRLLETCAILLHRLRNRGWPQAAPKLVDLATWMDADPAWLAKVGTGERPMSFAKFDSLWTTAAHGAPGLRSPDEAVSSPFPLFVAAKIFGILLIQRRQDAAGRPETTIHTLGRETYGHFWLQRLAQAKAQASARSVSLGDRPWPKQLASSDALGA